MDNPDLYKKSSDLRDDDHAQLLDEFAPTFNWRVDGKDSVMDVGCAGGNVTTEIVLPRLPTTFSRLMGVDVNEKMIDYANKCYKIPKVSFSTLDIGGDVSEFRQKNDPFDHIITFFCLHLVPDQKRAVQNIYDLLETNGDCFLHILADFSGFDIYKAMYPRWSEYMVNIDNFISPYYHRIDPVNMLKNHLKNAGFTQYTVVERRRIVAYHNIQEFIGAFKPIIPFFKHIPLERHSEFFDEFCKLAMEIRPDEGIQIEKFKASQNVNIFVSYKFVIAYARK
ncbi:Juvenile hormone acid O-methyltransferase [Pseudolycoriella hygida]|uniref:Juvenile hormone acid O-methyltransferase n=1 Tax=Pseudolycoriella hygida TaxID=35572 RepID=A0A9Q0RTW0_9DIPT|nr:Juvenile hormone acid O-methyltransferase [Pseudolycoriella hygida]